MKILNRKDLKNLSHENEELRKVNEILQLEENAAKNNYTKIEKVINDAAHAITIFLSVFIFEKIL